MTKTCTLVLAFMSMFMLSACNSSASSEQAIVVPPVSVQLWSVKDKLKADFEGTLRTLSDLGFKGVEFAGDYGKFTNDPEGLKAFLASIGLQASGAHIPMHALKANVLTKNLRFLKKLGVELVIIPVDSRAWHADGVESLVADINSLAKELKKMGMRIGYHNHEKEFNAYKGATYWDYIALNTSPEVILQMDVGWVNYAKKDPIDYLTRYPNRTVTTHIKVRTHKGSGQSPTIGEDGYDWANHIKHTISVGGTRWLVLEQEEYPQGFDSMQAITASKIGLDKIIAEIQP